MSGEETRSTEPLAIPAPCSSETTATNASSVDVEPLHHPQEMAHVEVPHNVENVPQGASLMTGKALLAKKMAATGASFYSPSDALVSPCTQKLSSQKGKRWANAKVKPSVFGKSNLNQSAVSSSLEARLDESVKKVDVLPNSTADPSEPENASNTPASNPDPSPEAVAAST